MLSDDFIFCLCFPVFLRFFSVNVVNIWSISLTYISVKLLCGLDGLDPTADFQSVPRLVYATVSQCRCC